MITSLKNESLKAFLHAIAYVFIAILYNYKQIQHEMQICLHITLLTKIFIITLHPCHLFSSTFLCAFLRFFLKKKIVLLNTKAISVILNNISEWKLFLKNNWEFIMNPLWLLPDFFFFPMSLCTSWWWKFDLISLQTLSQRNK